MAIYPSLGNPLNGMKVKNINKVLTSTYQGNYKQTRKGATRTRLGFTCDYLLSQSVYTTLETFFNENVGSEFTFVHPVRETVHTCTFANAELEATYKTSDLISVSVEIEEV